MTSTYLLLSLRRSTLGNFPSIIVSAIIVSPILHIDNLFVTKAIEQIVGDVELVVFEEENSESGQELRCT